MMSRKNIPENVQNSILTKSRRRCCLCFWLEGKDEVQKGQIAHLDQNNENPDEDNLVFLCFDHHDEYDGVPRLAKGLRESEVRHWREELYREMEYRFRSFRAKGFRLEVIRFKAMGPQDQCNLVWRLTNTGEVSVRSPTVTIQLLEGMRMRQTKENVVDTGFGMQWSMPVVDPFAMSESTADFFESNGRVGIKEMGGMNPLLMPGHKWEFEEIEIGIKAFPLDSEHEVHYRIDTEDHAPTTGFVRFRIPDRVEGFDIEDFTPPENVDDKDE